MVKRRENKHPCKHNNNELETSSQEFVQKAELLDYFQSPEGKTFLMQNNNDDSLLSAKTYWIFGEWQKLIELDDEALQNHPDRGRLSLLIASAHQQLDDHDNAQRLVHSALDWGCPKRLVAQILIAGVHNTLGRVAALSEDESRIAHHFQASIAAIRARDAELVCHARSVREMTRLGLLPQAAALVEKQLQISHDQKRRPQEQGAHYQMIRTEIELLSHELSLAQQRRQLFSDRPPNGSAPSNIGPSNPNWVEDIKYLSFSQIGQDLWVLEQTGYKRNGYFVEFGATDGVLLSNTYLLENKFAWSGVCIEPNPKLFEKLKLNRTCKVSMACIGATTGEEVEFIFADAFGGIKSYAHEDMHSDKRMAYFKTGEATNLITISLNDFLKQINAPRDIDYISIDTEGSEYDIIRNFPFEEWNIQMMTIEHNYTERRADVRKLMRSKGYHCTEKEFDDWYHKDS